MKVFHVVCDVSNFSITEGYDLGDKPFIDMGDSKIVPVFSRVNGPVGRLEYAALLRNHANKNDLSLEVVQDSATSMERDKTIESSPLGLFIVEFKGGKDIRYYWHTHFNQDETRAATRMSPFCEIIYGIGKGKLLAISPYLVTEWTPVIYIANINVRKQIGDKEEHVSNHRLHAIKPCEFSFQYPNYKYSDS